MQSLHQNLNHTVAAVLPSFTSTGEGLESESGTCDLVPPSSVARPLSHDKRDFKKIFTQSTLGTLGASAGIRFGRGP